MSTLKRSHCEIHLSTLKPQWFEKISLFAAAPPIPFFTYLDNDFFNCEEYNGLVSCLSNQDWWDTDGQLQENWFHLVSNNLQKCCCHKDSGKCEKHLL